MQTEICSSLEDAPSRFRSDADIRIQRSLRRWSKKLATVRAFLRAENGARAAETEVDRTIDTTFKVIEPIMPEFSQSNWFTSAKAKAIGGAALAIPSTSGRRFSMLPFPVRGATTPRLNSATTFR